MARSGVGTSFFVSVSCVFAGCLGAVVLAAALLAAMAPPSTREEVPSSNEEMPKDTQQMGSAEAPEGVVPIKKPS